MKITKETLLSKTPYLFNTPEGVYDEFHDFWWDDDEKDKPQLPGHIKLLYADYTYEDYSGDAYVLGYNEFSGQFFEVHGSHCSCNGLEGQWAEEYFGSMGEMEGAFQDRFCARSPYSRYAYSSASFQKWLEE